MASGGGEKPFSHGPRRIGADRPRLNLLKLAFGEAESPYPESGRGNDHRRKFSYAWANTRRCVTLCRHGAAFLRLAKVGFHKTTYAKKAALFDRGGEKCGLA